MAFAALVLMYSLGLALGLASYPAFTARGGAKMEKNAWFQPFTHARNFQKSKKLCYFGILLRDGHLQ